MKRVLVTGASGFVGRELVSLLAARGYEGVASGREPPEHLPLGWQPVRRDEVCGGSCTLGPIDAVIHLEVRHHVTNVSPRTVAELNAVNVGGTHQWLEWAAIQNVRRFVLASSIKAVRPQQGPTYETAAPEAADPYGRSKAQAEEAVRRWAAADPSRAAAILRLAPVYGPGSTANLAAFARQVLRGRPCFVGQGLTCKSVVSLRNAVAAFKWALENLQPGCEIFNVADRTTRTVIDLANVIAGAAGAPRPRGVPMPVACVGAVAGDVAGMILRRPTLLNSRRLRAMLETTVFPPDKLLSRGFDLPQETEDGIAELVSWLMRGSKPGVNGGGSRAEA